MEGVFKIAVAQVLPDRERVVEDVLELIAGEGLLAGEVVEAAVAGEQAGRNEAAERSGSHCAVVG